jgi:hypothetical protein
MAAVTVKFTYCSLVLGDILSRICVDYIDGVLD